MRRRRPNRNTGFTLMEVLVSCVLIGLVFTAVMSAASRNARNLSRVKQHEAMVSHAREKMDEVLLRSNLIEGTETGEWSDGMRWTIQITPYGNTHESSARGVVLYSVNLQVSAGPEGKARSYVFATTQSIPTRRVQGGQQ